MVLTNVFGNFFLKRGMPPPPPISAPMDYIAALFQPWVALGVVLLILWQLSRMALLSWADLSYVLPVTSIGYVLVALLGRVLLNEQITPVRWAGIVLIMAGVALVSGGTPPQTAYREAVAPMKWVVLAVMTCGHHHRRSAAGGGHAAARRDPRLPSRRHWARARGAGAQPFRDRRIRSHGEFRSSRS